MHFPNATEQLRDLKNFEDHIVVRVPLTAKYKLQVNPIVSFKRNFGGNISGFMVDPKGILDIYEFVNNTVLPRFMRFF